MAKKNWLGFGLFGKKAEEEKTQTEHVDHNTMEELTRELIQSSMPRNLLFGATTQKTIDSISRDVEYLNRHEIYNDSFTREMVKVIIARAIGTTHNDTLPFQLSISKKANIKESVRELIKEDLSHIEHMVEYQLMAVTMDSQFYGDGYTAIESEQGKGITDLIYNFSTKPFNITSFMTNKGNTVAHEVSANISLFSSKKQNLASNGRNYVSPARVARMNAKPNGVMNIQAENIISIENMNAFADKEVPYEDFVYGGVVEGCLDSFHNYKWAVNALANMRISSSMIERFITHTLESTNEKERKLLKAALENKIKAVRDAVKKRVDEKDPSVLVANHIIPTTSENTNSVQIQESTPQFNQQIDDILFHIKVYLADIGFNIDMTPFSQSMIGGGEKDGVVQNSLQMDTQGEQIRGAIRGYIKHIVSVHFAIKYGMEIDTRFLVVDFVSTINKAKIDAETQRMEAIGNISQIGGVITELKSQQFEDTPANRTMIQELMKDTISNTATDKEEVISAMIDHILTPPKEPEGEM
ncbi:hypothetical protein [Sulfurovum sp.]|uniref:hypothetical protein n=1 Tax=Sulfurovum sp. TaxID=1969726 RepID=UPI0025D9D78B|nr:hypothetical protein [Sulfurovum sp.]